jgi:hypothetical protein
MVWTSGRERGCYAHLVTRSIHRQSCDTVSVVHILNFHQRKLIKAVPPLSIVTPKKEKERAWDTIAGAREL